MLGTRGHRAHRRVLRPMTSAGKGQPSVERWCGWRFAERSPGPGRLPRIPWVAEWKRAIRPIWDVPGQPMRSRGAVTAARQRGGVCPCTGCLTGAPACSYGHHSSEGMPLVIAAPVCGGVVAVWRQARAAGVRTAVQGDSWEAVGDPYWNVRLAKGVCTGGLQMDVVNEQGDMMAPTGCCKGVGGFGEEVLKLP